MADHSVNALHAAARAMEEVVLPAIDAKHPLAREQAGLVLRYLRLFEQRMDHAYQRNRFDLARACELGQALMAPPFDVSAAITQALQTAIQTGQQLLSNPSSRPSALQQTTTEIARVTTALIRTLAAVRPEISAQVERLVLEKSAAWLGMQRAWFLPQGWEPDPSVVPSIDDLV